MINRIEVTGEDKQFRAALDAISVHMRKQPGFLSYRLYRSLREPTSYAMVSHWDSAEAHIRATRDNQEAQRLIGRLRELASNAPVVYETIESVEA
jgi:quinol monooxygenase YgiN